MSDELEHVRAVKQANEAQWLALDGVVAVGIGQTVDESMCIVVSVEHDSEQLRKEIPARIEDVPVELRDTGRFKARGES